MAKFKITKTTTVGDLKNQFASEIGGTLRIYDGRNKAEDDVTLASLGAKIGELECRTSRTVGKFEEAFENELNLKVKVFTVDDWVQVLSGVTLESVAKIKRQARKTDMEQFVAYGRKEREVESEAVEEIITDDIPNKKEAEIHFHKGVLSNLPNKELFCCIAHNESDSPLGYSMGLGLQDRYFFGERYDVVNKICDAECGELYPLIGTEYDVYYAIEEDIKGMSFMQFCEICAINSEGFDSLKEYIEDEMIPFDEWDGESIMESLDSSNYPFDVKVFDDDQQKLIAIYHVNNFDDIGCEGDGI
ncbi:MAG: hypothetical protein J6X22_04205 [Muribaculaceae bacterium]|nr:hypothetical protein [Muribaculaceae bacterium]